MSVEKERAKLKELLKGKGISLGDRVEVVDEKGGSYFGYYVSNIKQKPTFYTKEKGLYEGDEDCLYVRLVSKPLKEYEAAIKDSGKKWSEHHISAREVPVSHIKEMYKLVREDDGATNPD